MVCDEPILYIPDEGVPTMGNSQRLHHAYTRRKLVEEAGLQYFLGNQLFLSRYMSHRATMTTDAFGLRERPENTIQTSIHRLLHDQETWGDEETVVLRDVMQAGDGNHLSLRVHKYHAICMCALDDASSEIEASDGHEQVFRGIRKPTRTNARQRSGRHYHVFEESITDRGLVSEPEFFLPPNEFDIVGGVADTRRGEFALIAAVDAVEGAMLDFDTIEAANKKAYRFLEGCTVLTIAVKQP